MTPSVVARRRKARIDVERAADHYDGQGGQDLAFRFLGAVEIAISALAARPGLGSSRYGDLLGAPGLRSRSVKRFPYLIFYTVDDRQVEVIRILHARSDIVAHLQDELP